VRVREAMPVILVFVAREIDVKDITSSPSSPSPSPHSRVWQSIENRRKTTRRKRESTKEKNVSRVERDDRWIWNGKKCSRVGIKTRGNVRERFGILCMYARVVSASLRHWRRFNLMLILADDIPQRYQATDES